MRMNIASTVVWPFRNPNWESEISLLSQNNSIHLLSTFVNNLVTANECYASIITDIADFPFLIYRYNNALHSFFLKTTRAEYAIKYVA